jgi:5-methyltetrahydrofolate--homocysteine methyltransferase
MGIVNAGRLPVYDDIPADLLEDVVLARRADATERMLGFAETVRGVTGSRREDDQAWRDAPVAERLAFALVQPARQAERAPGSSATLVRATSRSAG